MSNFDDMFRQQFGNNEHRLYMELQHQQDLNRRLNNRISELESAAIKEKTMAKKHFKVIKENFLWEVGAILELKDGKYFALEGVDMWDKIEDLKDQSIHKDVVEKSPEYFEKVYPINMLTKTVYKAKAEAQEIWNKVYKDEGTKVE